MIIPRIVVSPFLCVYFGTALLSFLIPLIVYGAARGRLANQNNQNDDQNNNNNNGEQQYYQTCRWWQWGCNKGYYYEDVNQNNNQNNQDQVGTPWWWFFASEEDKRRREESQSNNPAMVLVYIWSMLLFMTLVWYGYRQVRNGSDLYRVVAAFAVFANFSFMSMFLVGGLEGGVQTEGRELEEQGFYAQFGVMMFITYLIQTLFITVYSVLFLLRAKRSEVTKIIIDESDYKIHDDDKEAV